MQPECYLRDDTLQGQASFSRAQHTLLTSNDEKCSVLINLSVRSQNQILEIGVDSQTIILHDPLGDFMLTESPTLKFIESLVAREGMFPSGDTDS